MLYKLSANFNSYVVLNTAAHWDYVAAHKYTPLLSTHSALHSNTKQAELR